MEDQARHKRKHRSEIAAPAGSGVELNVMPFIDIFSLLCTFLLFSTVFITIGILELQVPFFTNKAEENPATEPDKKPPPTLDISVEVKLNEIVLKSYVVPDSNRKETVVYPLETLNSSATKASLAKLNKDLSALKAKYPASDRVTLFADDSILYKQLVGIIDAVKYQPASPGSRQEDLLPKVIMGDVLM